MIAPTQRSVLLFGLGIPISLLPTLLASRLWPVWVAFLGISFLLIGVDLVLVVTQRRVRSEHDAPPQLYIGDKSQWALTLFTRGKRPLLVEALIQAENTETSHVVDCVASVDGTINTIPLVPLRRGTVEMGAAWLRWCGPLKLVQRTARVPLDLSIPVVPNIRAVRDAAVRFLSTRDFLSGLKRQHYIGDGSEFENLEEYKPGLDHRGIDWKASARHRKLLVREFRAERNHQVFLTFDTGHLMGEPLDRIPKLDHAINAALLLGYVCLKSGDRVGMFAFDDQVRHFSDVAAGVSTIHRLQAGTAKLAYGDAETNFTLGLTTLLTRLRRRSLVVVFTDFVDTITAELMLDNLNRLSRRHLVVFVSFRDRVLDIYSRAEPHSLTDVSRAVVSRGFARQREVVLKKLQRLGVYCIEAPTAQIPVALINRYLEIKRREML